MPVIYLAILSAAGARSAAAQDAKTQGEKVFADQKCAPPTKAYTLPKEDVDALATYSPR